MDIKSMGNEFTAVSIVFAFLTTILSINSIYANAIIVSSRGKGRNIKKLYEKKANILFRKAAICVIFPISTISVLIASVHIANDRSLNQAFAPIVVLVFILACVHMYIIFYIINPKFAMQPLGDWIAIQTLGKITKSEEMSIIIGRSLVTIAPLASLMIIFVDYFIPK